MRRCPFANCRIPIANNKFACGHHWRSLTLAEQTYIYDLFERFTDGKIDLDTMGKAQNQIVSIAQSRMAQLH